MLDTVKLQINLNDVKVYSLYLPEISDLDRKIGFNKIVRNPTVAEKKQGIYMPRITIIKRGYKKQLYIEFSVPKMIFNENVNEVDESMFDEVVSLLQKRLLEIGINSSIEVLKHAEVVTMHPAKNIQLQSGYTSSFIISELSKVNVDKRLDVSGFDFIRSNGRSLQFYTKEHSFVIYDKMADLTASRTKAIDKDKTNKQLDIYKILNEKQGYNEILRFEVRLCTKPKVREMLAKVGYTDEITFEKIFNKDICQRLVYYYWSKFITMNTLSLYDIEDSPQKMYQKLRLTYPEMTARKIIYLYGLSFVCRDNDGIKGFRSILSKKEWESVSRDFKYLDNSIQDIQPFIKQIDDKLLVFSRFRHKTDINDKKLSA